MSTARVTALCLLALTLVGLSPRAMAQQDLVLHCRELAKNNDRAQALRLLGQRLAEAPDDLDARTLYGLILSWDARYSESRLQLQKVLAKSPNNTDAALALIHTELWAGNRDVARDLIDKYIKLNPGNSDFLGLRTSLKDNLPGLVLSTENSFDWFNKSVGTWTEYTDNLKAPVGGGSVITRFSRASRYNLQAVQGEIETYQTLRKGTYVYLNTGTALSGVLYPHYRIGAEVFQSLTHHWEISSGFRYLRFADPVTVYTASLTRYHKNWMFTGRTYLTPSLPGTSATYQCSGRRYFGDKTNYWGLLFSRGSTPVEIQSLNNIGILNETSIQGDLNKALSRHWAAGLRSSYGHEDRITFGAVRHVTANAYLSYGF